MKILLTVHQFVPEWSAGTEILTFSVAKELMRRGHQVTVFTGFPVAENPPADQRIDRYEIEGISVYRYAHAMLATAEQAATTEIEYDNHLATRLFDDLVANVQPDIIHFFHFFRLGSGLIDVAVKRGILAYFTPTDFWTICPTNQLLLTDNTMCKGPSCAAGNCIKHIVMLTRGEKERNFMSKLPTPIADISALLISKLFAKRHHLALEISAMVKRSKLNVARVNQLQRIFSPSRLMTETLVNNGINADLMQSTAFGIDVSGYEHAQTRTGVARTIGFIGTISETKGCHVLINAFKQLNLPDVRLKMYGSFEHYPDYAASLQALAAECDAIEFCGTFPNQQIAHVLSELDALVVPSLWYENTPLVVYSALAARCPVVASNFAGMSEVVRHNENGLLFTAGDADLLAEALRSLATTADLLPRLSANCQPPKSTVQYVDEIAAVYQHDLAANKK
jgi:glycosyltransferase involved in cell wall biosynthesis